MLVCLFFNSCKREITTKQKLNVLLRASKIEQGHFVYILFSDE